MRTLQAHFVAFVCCVMCMTATRATAEIPEMDAARMREIASHILVGKVTRIYFSPDRPTADGGGVHSIAEMRITKVEKGKHDSPLAYVRFTNRVPADDSPIPSGSSGQRGLPKVGATMRVYVVTGDDGGFDVLPPNGFTSITDKRP